MKIKDIYNPLCYVKSPDMCLKYLFDGLDKDVEEEYVDLDPVFQRGHVWTLEQQELFMGHMLTGGVVQPILFSLIGNIDTGKYVLLDGKQRLFAIRLWMNNEIEALTLSGVRFKSSDVEDLNTYLLRISIKFGYVHLSNNPKEAWRKTLDLYLKLNTGGTPHSASELAKVKDML